MLINRRIVDVDRTRTINQHFVFPRRWQKCSGNFLLILTDNTSCSNLS